MIEPFTAEEARREAEMCEDVVVRCVNAFVQCGEPAYKHEAARFARYAASWRLYAEMLESFEAQLQAGPRCPDCVTDPKGA